MTTATTRQFIREFARIKRAAANGHEIVVRDRGGNAFLFRSVDTGPSLGDQLADLRGALETGRKRKSLQGFGRNRG